ncbi:MAG: FtsX-like permease family protein [Planctomycetes bacterium]|nr:FtsX-like permease family protein [Planctomycetota bacterium]
MDFFSAVRVALSALLVHKGRSALTSLGIVIGTGAVIAMVSAAGGARQKLDERLDNVGKNLILVRAGVHTQAGAIADLKPLTNEDAAVLRKNLGSLVQGVAEVQVIVRIATTRTHNWKTMITGTHPDMQTVRGWTMAYGRYFDRDDLKKRAAVCLLGQTAREKLFPDRPNPVGQLVRVDQLQLRVIGVCNPKGRSPTGGDQDDQIFVPISTLQKKLVGEEHISIILTSVASSHLLEKAKEEAARLLREKRRVKEGQEDFDVSSVQEMAELAVILTATMQILILIVASISLVVGGIGIMNIMLVSVTERTREIGIRMAVGATPGDVLLQFLIEAIALALVGGVLGISLGMAGAIALALIAGWPVQIDPNMVLIAFAVSGGVGIFFGFYPALKASRLDPIEALRYE